MDPLGPSTRIIRASALLPPSLQLGHWSLLTCSDAGLSPGVGSGLAQSPERLPKLALCGDGWRDKGHGLRYAPY